MTDLLEKARLAAAQSRNLDARAAYHAVLAREPGRREALLGLCRLPVPHQYPRLAEELGRVIWSAPWDFEAIDALLVLDPCYAAQIAAGVLQMRGADPPTAPAEPPPLAHPVDGAMLGELQAAPEVSQRVARQRALWEDGSFVRQMLLNTVQVGPAQMAGLWELQLRAAQRLGMAPVPLFVAHDPEELNAFAGGAVDCFVCLTSGLLDALTDEQLLFVLGHELGHIMHHHVLFYQVADQLAAECWRSAASASAVGDGFAAWGGAVGLVGSLIADSRANAHARRAVAVVERALRWQQYSEFTADRCGLLAAGSLDAACGALASVAGLNPAGGISRFGGGFNLEAFLQQFDRAAREYSFAATEEDHRRSHPYTALRIRSLQAWRMSRAYQVYFQPGSGYDVGEFTF